MAAPVTFPGYVNPTGGTRAVLLDAGVVYTGTGTPTLFAPTRGGITWDPGREVRQIPFDGLSTPLAGNYRVTAYNAKLSGRFLLASLADIANLEHGGTLVPIAGSTPGTLTPIDAQVAITEADIIADVWFIGRRSDGKILRVYMEFGFVESMRMVTEDKGEGMWDVTIAACLAGDATNLNAAPYVYSEI